MCILRNGGIVEEGVCLTRIAPPTAEELDELRKNDDRILIFGELPVPGPTMPASLLKILRLDQHDVIQLGSPVAS